MVYQRVSDMFPGKRRGRTREFRPRPVVSKVKICPKGNPERFLKEATSDCRIVDYVLWWKPLVVAGRHDELCAR